MHKSLRLSFDATGMMKKVPFSSCSLTKWKCTSMCLERSEIFGLDAMSIAALLSQRSIGVVVPVPVISVRAFFNQISCFEARERAWYSASAVEVETDFCFLERQEIVALSSCTMLPEIDLRVKGQFA